MFVKLSFKEECQYVEMSDEVYDVIKDLKLEYCSRDEDIISIRMEIVQEMHKSTIDILENVLEPFEGEELEYDLIIGDVKNDMRYIKKVFIEIRGKLTSTQERLISYMMKKHNIKAEDVNDWKIEDFKEFEVGSFEDFMGQRRMSIHLVLNLDYDNLTESHIEFILEILGHVDEPELSEEIMTKMLLKYAKHINITSLYPMFMMKHLSLLIDSGRDINKDVDRYDRNILDILAEDEFDDTDTLDYLLKNTNINIGKYPQLKQI